MPSEFYKRYVPPKKPSKNGANPTKRAVPKPKIQEGPVKRPTPEPETREELPKQHAFVEKHGLTPLPQPEPAEEGPEVSVSSALPDWIRKPTIASGSDSEHFDSFSLSPDVVSNLQKNGFTTANGLQSTILPILLPGHVGPKQDICISAATGSGKTLAYMLPLIESLRNKPVRRLRGLVVVPTRELVAQARDTLESCAAGTGIQVGTAVGSKSLKDEQALLIHKGQKYDPEAYKVEQEKKVDEDEKLMNWDFDAMLDSKDNFESWNDHVVNYTSKIDVLISTPGRLVDHIQSTKGFSLEHVQWLVLDEADRLLDESFQQWVEVVVPQLEYLPPLDIHEQLILDLYHIPRRREIRKIILSATMTRDIGKLTPLKLRQSRLVMLEGDRGIDDLGGNQAAQSFEQSVELPATLYESAMSVAKTEDKPLYLLQLLAEYSPTDTSKPESLVQEGKTEINMKDACETSDTNDDDNSNSSSSEFLSSADLDSDSPPAAPSTRPEPGFASKRSDTHATKKISHPSSHPTRGILVFANSSESALRLARLLSLLLPGRSSQIAALTKAPSEKKGRATLNAFRRGELSIVIATDLASRGLDIQGLAYVINYDLPTSLHSYVHRVGRTARAGKEGRATTLVEYTQATWFWNEIARSKSIVRARKVDRINVGLQTGRVERDKYEGALRVLGREAQGKDMKKGK